MSYINLLHWLLIAPLFIYVGLMKDKTSPAIFTLLFTMGVITFIYHFYQWIISIRKKQIIKTI